MGFKQVDFAPLQAPSALTPTGKSHLVKVFTVSRTDTAPSVKAVLPAQASIINIYHYGGTASDAGTSADVDITVSNNAGTVSTGTVDMVADGALTEIVQMSGLPNVEPTPNEGDLKISAVYSETGTASSTGGPWKFSIEYVA